MRIPDEGVEIVQGAEFIVNAVIIYRVVAVVGRREKDRVEVNGIYAQVEQIIQALADALQVTAVKTARGGAAVPGLDDRGIVGGVSIVKTIGENLVENRVRDPGGDGHGSSVKGKDERIEI